ncbi:Magnesium-transporting ATPase, P-type 1 [Andreprevotia sp. IGB-42]|uniref:magnesium-translocating P-type ATPase n=1 Tax=Andreprevotia sp. IGB-42 TaxID=2497473 RepID=UPI00135A4C08|nr:magnesium-translocating P-type ATPase [Andreprevotia sp. IGB-42]KAF0813605.1 Magnesium-transporting ATPase, P-type 1 [Andreprevotia sp. IGB-42]
MRFEVFKKGLLTFMQKGLSARQFRRLALLDLLRGEAVGKEMPQQLAERMVALAQLAPDAALQQLAAHQDGLSEREAEIKREAVGLNEVAHEKPMPWWVHLWLCYRNPFNVLLTVLAIVSYLTEDMKAAIVIGAMVVISTLLRFVQEKRSNTAADKLKEMVSNTATVLRRDPARNAAPEAEKYFGVHLHPHESHRAELAIKLLVPGDIVVLSAGDMIPADVRVLTAKDLFVSQAALTGEALPVEKFVAQRDAGIQNPLEQDNLCFMGTNVVSGTATALVIGTGNQTYFGALAERVTAQDRTPTQFQAGVNKVSWILIRFMFVMAPLVLFINGFTKGDWVEAALFALSIAVGLTPEMLPMIVTSTLAKGAVILSRKKVIVKRLDAIQNFGAMDILCTDKTGTLTQDKIVLERHTDVFGEMADDVLEMAYLNSYYQTGLKNLLDVAVLEHAEIHKELNVASNYRKVDEIPFDFVRRRMSVVVSEHEDRHLLICKGALEEILSACSQVAHGDAVEALTDELLARIRKVTTALNQEGLRVVAVATRQLPPERDTYSVADESALTLVGYIAFLDPPKETTAPALRALKANGVEVKVLTGDNELVTLKVCKEVGLTVKGVLLGSQVDTLDDGALAHVAENTTVFAKLSPTQKERLVRVLRAHGHVVGFMGDGINDAPALRAADIGISVDSAVDIAKEAADIILLEKSLMVLEAGVIEGRKTFANMLKYIKMTASSNFGNVFSVLVASAFIPFLPMLPLHLLVQNLLYDISQIAIPFDNVDEASLTQPQQWNPDELSRFMVFFGPISSVFDISTFALMWFVFGADSAGHQTLFQSGWFVEGLLSQTLIVHMIRTRKVPFIQSRAAWPLLAMTGLIVAIGIFLPMGPLAHYFKLQALPLSYFPWLVGILLAYVAATQAMKHFYAKRYGWQ